MPPVKRIAALDNFRGLALWLMVAGNFLAGVTWVPAIFKHTSDIGLTVADVVAPFFIFAIGVTYRLAFERRLQTHPKTTVYLHFIKRYATLIVIGFVLSSGEIWVEVNQSGTNWGVLQSIGVAGLITLTVIHQPMRTRLFSGLFLLAIYQYLLDHYWLAKVLNAPHGGWQGALGWSSMLILSTVLSDLYHQKTLSTFIRANCLTLATGLLSSWLIPVSKNRVSAAYILICLGISGLLLGAFTYLDHQTQHLPRSLNRWGKNPLTVYLLHNLLLAIFVLPPYPGWYQEANPLLTTGQLLLLLFSIDQVVNHLERRQLIISL